MPWSQPLMFLHAHSSLHLLAAPPPLSAPHRDRWLGDASVLIAVVAIQAWWRSHLSRRSQSRSRCRGAHSYGVGNSQPQPQPQRGTTLTDTAFAQFKEMQHMRRQQSATVTRASASGSCETGSLARDLPVSSSGASPKVNRWTDTPA